MDKIEFGRWPTRELEQSFLEMHDVCTPEESAMFFNDRIWDIWKLHEIHSDFSQMLELWRNPISRLHIIPKVIILRESSPDELQDVITNVFGKRRTEEVFLEKLKNYDQRSSQFLLDSDCQSDSLRKVFRENFKQLLKDATNNTKLEFSNWLLVMGNIWCSDILEVAVANAFNNVVKFDNIRESAYCLLSAAINNKFDIGIMFSAWRSTEQKRLQHLQSNLARAIVDEYSYHSTGSIFQKVKILNYWHEDILKEIRKYFIEKAAKIVKAVRRAKKIELDIDRIGQKKIERFESRIINIDMVDLSDLYLLLSL